MRFKFMTGLLAGVAIPALAAAADGWQAYQTVADNYFEGSGNAAHVVLVLQGTFNSCGWNNAGQLNMSAVGSEQYRALTDLLLVAMSEGRTVSVGTSGCINGRANIVGLKLGN